MGFKKHVKVWEDVLKPEYDEKAAPSLWEVVLGEAPPIYGDAREFFRRTYLTSSMKDAIESSVKAIKGEGNSCLLYTSPSPRDRQKSRMPSSA